MNFKLTTLILSTALCGCVALTATKATGVAGKAICIVDNPAVRSEFRQAYENQIRARGYETRVVTDSNACPITTTYNASYGFHWGLYLSTAELKIFDKGAEIGNSVYNAPFASPEKHGRVEDKIAAMLTKMLP